jgi:bile acid-coenzyme A ligase
VGRPYGQTEIEILDDAGQVVPAGEVGGIYLRKPGGPDAAYVGDQVQPLVTTDDGFVTVGDMGWIDEDGFLYLADRRVDMIVTGGVNVFPAEVEAALSEHAGIADVVVVGLHDPEWGRRIHAIVQPVDPHHPLEPADIIAFAKDRLAPYKVPKSVELIAVMPRNDIMKINRATLTDERDGQSPAGATA